jgi:hypothetical protein
MFNNIFFRNSYRVWDNVKNIYIVDPDRPQLTIRRMRISCWIPKATNTHSQYAILITLPLQQWLHERASMLRYTYTVCLSSWTPLSFQPKTRSPHTLRPTAEANYCTAFFFPESLRSGGLLSCRNSAYSSLPIIPSNGRPLYQRQSDTLSFPHVFTLIFHFDTCERTGLAVQQIGV